MPSRSYLRHRADRGRFSSEADCALARAGESLPFFARHRLALDGRTNRLLVRQRGRGGDRHTLSLGRTGFDTVLASTDLGYRARFLFQPLGHVVFLCLGSKVCAVDPLNGKLLWQRDLLPDAARPPVVTEASGSTDGSVRVVYRHGGPQ